VTSVPNLDWGPAMAVESEGEDSDFSDLSEDLQRGESDTLLVEQYADALLDFSGQYGSDGSFSYTAINVLGKPATFPEYGDFAETYALREVNGHSWSGCASGRAFNAPLCKHESAWLCMNFVDLGFQHAVDLVSAIYVYETYHPGAVSSVWAGDGRHRWFSLWKRDSDRHPAFPGHHPRAFSPPILAQAPFPTRVIRLIFCHLGIPGASELDAVALLGNVILILAKV